MQYEYEYPLAVLFPLLLSNYMHDKSVSRLIPSSQFHIFSVSSLSLSLSVPLHISNSIDFSQPIRWLSLTLFNFDLMSNDFYLCQAVVL